ncbi:hypothetical protein ASD89_15095 [Caulobacter sp. Root656]|nr:hypothetical protein ASD89_15095 [Caulobacter sp. Root656]
MPYPPLLPLLLGLALAAAPALAGAETWRCSATKGPVSHDLSATVEGERVTGFDYLASTKGASEITSCSLAPEGGPTVGPGGVTTFPLTDDDVAVARRSGDTIVFDFTQTRLSNYCGQSSTIAATLTLKAGAKRCLAVKNQ